jgi:tetrapyrrole methylase family protein/MazG family protein
MPYNEEQSMIAIKELLQTIHRLRAPGGCPWDQKQTHQSLRPYLVEETYETMEVLDQIHSTADIKNPTLQKAFIEEWGDVLLQIVLHAEIASEADSKVSFEAIVKQLNEKMIRRHPHVFGDVTVSGADDVVKNWAEIKTAEKGGTVDQSIPTSAFDGIPKGLPAFPRTMKLIQKVTKVGFQWPDVNGPLEKLQEEVIELREECTKNPSQEKIEAELGDVLFSACNIAHFYKIDPEAALRNTLRKFESRFRFVEEELLKVGKTPDQATLAEMDKHWELAKKGTHK